MTRDFSASFVIFATCHSFKTSMPPSIATCKTSYDDRTIVKGTWDKHWQCLEREKCMNHLILKQMVRIAHCAKRRSRTVDKDRLSEWKRILAVLESSFYFQTFLNHLTHYLKSQIFVKKFNFDKTLQFSREIKVENLDKKRRFRAVLDALRWLRRVWK